MLQCKTSNLEGFLFIGDPHISSRTPGLRKDDFARSILQKLEWCLKSSIENHLQPVILGDLFHFPKDNANWMLTELCRLLQVYRPVAIHGNHDCSANELQDDDSLSILHSAGLLPLLDRDGPWTGRIDGTDVMLGGASWGQKIPRNIDPKAYELPETTRAIWLTHHDLIVSGYEESGRIKPREIPGIDIVINGHLHHPVEPTVTGGTRWLVPGNISRVKNSDATAQFRPQVLSLRLKDGHWAETMTEVPHEPFEEVFHSTIRDTQDEARSLSGVVRGLKELIRTRTQTGAMLDSFLTENFKELEVPQDIQNEISQLKKEVLANDE